MIPLFWLKFYYACFNVGARRSDEISLYLLMTCHKNPPTATTCWMRWYWSLFRSVCCRGFTSEWNKIFIHMIMMQDNVFDWKICLMSIWRYSEWNIIIHNKKMLVKLFRGAKLSLRIVCLLRNFRNEAWGKHSQLNLQRHWTHPLVKAFPIFIMLKLVIK